MLNEGDNVLRFHISAVGWGTKLQAGRSRVRFLIRSLDYFQFIWSFQPHCGPGGRTHPLTEMSTRNLPGGKGVPARRADNFSQSVSRLSRKFWSLDISKSYGPPIPSCRASFTFYLSRDAKIIPQISICFPRQTWTCEAYCVGQRWLHLKAGQTLCEMWTSCHLFKSVPALFRM
jgi:hypothetical protein